MIIEAEKPLDLQEGSWRPRRAKGTNSSPSLSLEGRRQISSVREREFSYCFFLTYAGLQLDEAYPRWGGQSS